MHVAGQLIPMLRCLLAMAIVLWLPVRHLPSIWQLKRFTSCAVRLALYRRLILHSLLVALTAMLISWPNNLLVLSVAQDGISWLLGSHVVRPLAIAAIATIFLLMTAQVLYFAQNPTARARLTNATRSLRFMLPVSTAERRWAALAGINAGISEEVIFRGFLLQFLQGKLSADLGLSLTSAWLFSSLAFGLGHLYQGVGGIVRTGAVGLILGMTAILSGNLILPIVVHALMDLSVLLLYRPDLDSPEEADRLIRGCDPN